MQKPVSRLLFYQALHLLIATQNRWQRFDRENQKLRTKMEEVRIVARAKCILVEYLRMSGQQAHRYIEKQAMDMRTSKKDVMENILENLYVNECVQAAPRSFGHTAYSRKSNYFRERGTYVMGNKAYLVLENGKVFCGESFGAAGMDHRGRFHDRHDRLSRNAQWDKSYFGQIVVQTFPLIGNYGVIPSDFEGKIIGPCGYIVKNGVSRPPISARRVILTPFLKKEASSAFAASIRVPLQSSAKAAL